MKINFRPTTIGDVLKEAREKQNISPQELASKVGVSPSFIYQIESNTRDPKTTLLVKIGKTLKISQLDITNLKSDDDDEDDVDCGRKTGFDIA